MEITFGPDLAMRCERLPAPLLERMVRFLAYFRGESGATAEAVAVSLDETERRPAGETLLEEPPLVVRREGAVLHFDLPGIEAWCEPARGVAGIRVQRLGPPELDRFAGLVLAPLLVELAASRGRLGLHAASVSVHGAGVLLPGRSGAGKSTIFEGVHQAGHAVLSDDLTWLRPLEDGWRMFAFPRGDDGATRPTTDDRPLRLAVFPEIASGPDSRLTPMSRPEVMGALLEQSGFLSQGSVADWRFEACARIAETVPGYRLAAGRGTGEVPELLKRLVETEANQANR